MSEFFCMLFHIIQFLLHQNLKGLKKELKDEMPFLADLFHNLNVEVIFSKTTNHKSSDQIQRI